MGLFFARMTRRTLRRAAAGLFGPVEHFDELPQACLAPSNTSTSCRMLVWACRTLRRAVADYVLPKCVAERGTSYWLLCLTFAPVHSVPPSEESPPLRAEKGNPVKNRSSTRYCKSTFHPVSLSTQPLSEPFGREGAPRYTQDKPGNLPNEDLHNGASAALPSTSSGLVLCSSTHPKAFGLGRLASAPFCKPS